MVESINRKEALPIYVQLSICLENFPYSMTLTISSALISCFLTFTSLLWLYKETREMGLVFAAASVIGSLCSLELVSERNNNLLKWITISSFIALGVFNLSLYLEASDGILLVATALVGLCLAPIFMAAYETGVKYTKQQGVSEVMSTSLINTSACVISAIHHFIIIYWPKETQMVQVGMGLL